jgi:hypothetical protein
MITLVYGMPGMGKSTWMHDYLLGQPEQLYFVVDHEAGWGADGAAWRGRPPPLTVIEARDPIPKEFPDAGIFVFRGRDPYEIASLCVAVGHATYVDDEIDIAGRKGGFQGSALQEMVHRGRHAENAEGEYTQVNLVGACRRPQSLHTDITDLVDQCCIFRVRGKRTLHRLEEDSMIESEEDWQRIRNLPKFQFLHWPSGQWMKCQPVTGGKTGEAQNGKGEEDSEGIPRQFGSGAGSDDPNGG